MGGSFEKPNLTPEKETQEYTAFQIVKKFRDLKSPKSDKERISGENLWKFVERAKKAVCVNKEKKACFDFQSIIDWETRNPNLSIGQLLEKSGINPNEKFLIEREE